MNHVIKIGFYYYEVWYELDNRIPIIREVLTLSEVILFQHAMPVIFESFSPIPLQDLGKLTVDMGANRTLSTFIMESLMEFQSNPEMEAVMVEPT